jgi:hypothetical protein
MKMAEIVSRVLLLSFFASSGAFAYGLNPNIPNNMPRLDPPYPRYRRPVNLTGRGGPMDRVTKSNTAQLISEQTPIKSQGSRGTCSIFSATALIEGLVAKRGAPRNIDLSEEWLEAFIVAHKQNDGSNANVNLQTILNIGMASEQALPYNGQVWSDASFGLAQQRCGQVPSNFLKGCLLAHYDPRLIDSLVNGSPVSDPSLVQAAREAAAFKAQFLTRTSGVQMAYSSDEIKQSLANGIPIIFETDFFYGSWNHGKSESLGIPRNLNQWDQGIVTYPERGSLDAQNSRKASAGHSVLIVGYDDNVVVTNDVKMADGTIQRFTYKGVFYFKNSWGTAGFGAHFQIDGRPYPGYGMITQKYAMDYGSFFRLVLR